MMVSLLVPAGFYLYGCAPAADSTRAKTNSAQRQAADSNAYEGEPASTLVDARPAALVNGQSLTWGELRPALSELAGAEALQEAILDRRINETLATLGISITPDDIAAERKLLLESLNDDPNQALRLLDELRDRQKLGKVRFEALMRRNAALRALVRGQVVVSDEAIRNMHELIHGPRRQARLMVLPDLAAAQAAINLINSGVNFADVAVEVSTDSSAARGGLLEPISRVDPAYPESLRQTLWTLDPGQVSGPVMIENGFAVVMLVKRIAGDGTQMEENRPALERLVRLHQERLFMDQLARRLLADTQVTVFDESLHESWKRRR